MRHVLRGSAFTRYLLFVIPLYVVLNAGSCPPSVPAPPFDCDAPVAESSEVIEARNPVAGCYNVLVAGAPRVAIESAEAYATYVETWTSRYGVAEYTPLQIIVGFEARMEAAQAREMAADPELTVFECETMTIDQVASWGLDRIDQRDRPLDGRYDVDETGAGIHVSVNDTGEPFALDGFNVGECFSAVGGSCKDDHNHGSHVGGTIGHRRYGVAPDATMHWCKSLINGSGADADVIECIDWFVARCTENGWQCLGNMSLGGDASEPFDRALCASIDAGVGWAVAAGNSDENACVSSPSRVAQAVTAGATAANDRRASFSNTGACVDVFAPGVDITSINRSGTRTLLSGTSMASPHVAGVMALCAERLGTTDPTALGDCVLATASSGRVGNPGTDSPNRLLYAKAN